MTRLPQSDLHSLCFGQKEILASAHVVMLVRPSLQTETTAGLRRLRGRMAGILMLGLWLGLVGLASSERLHRLLHSASHQTNHEGLVTFFSKGYLLGAFVPAAVPLAIFVCFGLCRLAGDILHSIADIRLAP